MHSDSKGDPGSPCAPRVFKLFLLFCIVAEGAPVFLTVIPPTLLFGSGSALWGAGRHFGSPEKIYGCTQRNGCTPGIPVPPLCRGGRLMPLSAAAPSGGRARPPRLGVPHKNLKLQNKKPLLAQVFGSSMYRLAMGGQGVSEGCQQVPAPQNVGQSSKSTLSCVHPLSRGSHPLLSVAKAASPLSLTPCRTWVGFVPPTPCFSSASDAREDPKTFLPAVWNVHGVCPGDVRRNAVL